MLFKQEALEGIARGEVTVAFRRWKKPTVKAGSRVRTALGEVLIGNVMPVADNTLDKGAARRAGFATLAALETSLRGGEDRRLYRVEIAGIVPDARVALREAADIGEVERAEIGTRLARWDRSVGRDGYHQAILRLISKRPGEAAAELASTLGVEKLKFKRDVRKLKELGLTISLETGYRLSARGKVFVGGCSL